MGYVIYKDDGDRYVLFSSVVDDVVYYDLTRDEVLEVFREHAVEQANRQTEWALEAADERGSSSGFVRKPMTVAEAWQAMADTYNLNHTPELTADEYKARIRKMVAGGDDA